MDENMVLLMEVSIAIKVPDWWTGARTSEIRAYLENEVKVSVSRLKQALRLKVDEDEFDVQVELE